MTVRHVVMWKLAAEDAEVRAAQAAELVRRLEALVGVVPSIGSLSASVNTLFPEANFDVVLVSEFADEAALEAYTVHPVHQEVVAYVRSVVSARSAVDAVV